MVAGITMRKRPRQLDSAQRQEDNGLGAHRDEGARGKAWQRMAASSGAARSPATKDRGRAGDGSSSCSGLRRPTQGEAKRGECGDRLRRRTTARRTYPGGGGEARPGGDGAWRARKRSGGGFRHDCRGSVRAMATIGFRHGSGGGAAQKWETARSEWRCRPVPLWRGRVVALP
jgi:hypothetical protein